MRNVIRWITSPAGCAGVIAVVLNLALYSDVLTLPLFADDLIQVPWLQSVSWVELWTSPSPYGYYRPGWYSLWRIYGLLAGGLRPLPLHALNVTAHALAAWLSGLLAVCWAAVRDRESTLQVQASLATAFFVVFPFAREAVAWPGAVYNPIVSALAAGALLAYGRGRREARRGWMIVSIGCTALAPLMYEAGIMVGPLILLAEYIGWLGRKWQRQQLRLAMPHVMVSATLVLVWRLVRGSGVTGFGLNPYDVRRNWGYLVQGFVYPISPIAQRVAAWLRVDSELCLWFIALPVLAIVLWQARQKSVTGFYLGISWFVLFAVPPVFTMRADWFALAPRYLYLTATGAAITWAVVLSEPIEKLLAPVPLCRIRVMRVLLVVAIVGAMLGPATLFIREGVHLYRVAGDVIWAVVAAAARQRPILLVNLPQRITPRDRFYPLGFEGIIPLPKRVPAQQIVYAHTGIPDAVEALAFGVIATERPLSYEYELYGRWAGWQELAEEVRGTQTTYLTRYENERIVLLEAGGPLHADTALLSSLSRFGSQLELVRADTSCDASGQVQLTMVWRVTSPPATDATVFVHLLTEDGALIDQADGYPLLGMRPFWLWQSGETNRDLRYFLPVERGVYTVRIGVWESATGRHWPAGTPDGTFTLPVHCP